MELYLTTRNTRIHAPSGIRTRNLGIRSATDLHFRPLDPWDQLLTGLTYLITPWSRVFLEKLTG